MYKKIKQKNFSGKIFLGYRIWDFGSGFWDPGSGLWDLGYGIRDPGTVKMTATRSNSWQ